jgi:hypothetical protein
MKNNVTVTWFRRGFLATALILALVLLVLPRLGSAQDRTAGNPNLSAIVEAEPDVVIEDAPADLGAYLLEQGILAPEQYSPPLIIPGADFNRDGNASSYFYSFSLGSFISGVTDAGCFMAPVYLPHGVNIVNFFMYAYDNDTANFSANLIRNQNNSTAGTDLIAAVTTSGASTGIQIEGDITPDPNFTLVDRNYSYSVITCMFANTEDFRINGIWIFYED